MIIILLCLIALLLYYGNNGLKTTWVEICDEEIPESFSDYRITHISDLHNKAFGKNNKNLINKIKKTEPDIIVITGDMVDSRWTNIDVAVSFAKEITKIAPVYYVNGNNEARMKDYPSLKRGLINAGVTVLENDYTDIEINNEKITLIGLNDTGFALDKDIGETLKTVLPDNENYKILLAHRPEYFDKYVGINLVLSGHTHGGQIRIPFVGGIIAPGQGLFPKYDAGIYNEHGVTMFINRGLGNSLFPFRVNNNPEIVVVELKCKSN